MNGRCQRSQQGQVEVAIWYETQHRPFTFLTNLTDSGLGSTNRDGAAAGGAFFS